MQCSLPLCWHCWCPRHCQSHQKSRREMGRQLAKRRKAPVLQVPVGLHSGMQTACCDAHQACNKQLTSAEQNHTWYSMRAPPQQHPVCCNELQVCNEQVTLAEQGVTCGIHCNTANSSRSAKSCQEHQVVAGRPATSKATSTNGQIGHMWCSGKHRSVPSKDYNAAFLNAASKLMSTMQDAACPLCCIGRQ